MSERANQYAAKCRACGGTVAAGDGVLVPGEERAWEVEHRPGECGAPAPADGGDDERRAVRKKRDDHAPDLRCSFRVDGVRCPLGATWYPGGGGVTEGYCRAHGGAFGWWDEHDPAALLAEFHADPLAATERVYGAPPTSRA